MFPPNRSEGAAFADKPAGSALFTVRKALIAGAALLTLLWVFHHGSNQAPRDLAHTNVAAQPRCTPPPGGKELSYALMVDAGSTGSRLHVYTFRNCVGTLPQLVSEGFYTTQPGLSSYKGRPAAAADSLRVLMDHAVADVPADEHACTPLAVKATAGLRLLGASESTAILDAVSAWLKREYRFNLIADGVIVMDGKDEGVFAWITINYLLGAGESAAVMDLGGASTQIVFEPVLEADTPLAPGDHVYELDFAGSHHALYQHSHLGYGLMQARRAVHNLVAFTHVFHAAHANKVSWNSLTADYEMTNPCMFAGQKKQVTLDPPGRKSVDVTMVGTGRGFEACRRVVEVTLAKDEHCTVEPCAFAGVYQPRLDEVFDAGKVWALSYFYDRINPLGLTSPFSLKALRRLTKDVCAGPGSENWKRFKGNAEAMEELSGRPEYCLDLTFMYTLLSLGYDLDDDREIYIGKKIGDVELGWALGAAISMVDGAMECREVAGAGDVVAGTAPAAQ